VIVLKDRLVVIESPYAGARANNDAYLRDAHKDSLARGEHPFASHGYLPLVLDDADPAQRAQGMACGFAWGEKASARVVYVDLGISGGMRAGIEEAKRLGQPVVLRSLPAWHWSPSLEAVIGVDLGWMALWVNKMAALPHALVDLLLEGGKP
jgi:hypothetical protein